ncbi:MAG: hypothetical protein IPO08_00105 [Xanthomonadales bacterium]|nr:hypothetical protein [Xanthomonadales bacterium]
MEWREDRRIAHREDFTYDALNRLKTVQLRLNNGSPITTLSLTYDVLGNLCSKNGVVYAYPRPGQLQRHRPKRQRQPACGQQHRRTRPPADGAGRMSFAAGSTTATDRSYDYSGLGELRAARVGGVAPSAELQLRYNPEGERIKEVQTVAEKITTTRWVGNVEFIQSGSRTQIRRHIGGVAIESWFADNPGNFTPALPVQRRPGLGRHGDQRHRRHCRTHEL